MDTTLDERPIIELLSDVIRKILFVSMGVECTEDICRVIAENCWDALILSMRQAFSAGSVLILRDLGKFEEVTEQSWSFVPHPTVLEASTMKYGSTEAEDISIRSLDYHLTAAERLLRSVPNETLGRVIDFAPLGGYTLRDVLVAFQKELDQYLEGANAPRPRHEPGMGIIDRVMRKREGSKPKIRIDPKAMERLLRDSEDDEEKYESPPENEET